MAHVALARELHAVEVALGLARDALAERARRRALGSRGPPRGGLPGRRRRSSWGHSRRKPAVVRWTAPCYLPPTHEHRGRSGRRNRRRRDRRGAQGPGSRLPPPGDRARGGALPLERRPLPEDRRDRPRRRLRRPLPQLRRRLHGRVRRPARPRHEARRRHPPGRALPPGPLRQLPPGPLPRRPALPAQGLRGRRRRLRGVPREHRGLLRRVGRPPEEGHPGRGRRPGGRVHPQGRGAHRPLRLRVRPGPQAPACRHVRQVQRHALRGGPLAAQLRRGLAGVPGHRGAPTSTSTRSACRWSRTPASSTSS